jgi:hypothetical protein
MEQGRFGQAAQIFDRMAKEARDRGRLAPAARLALRAAHAHLAADEVDTALKRARRGLDLLTQSGRIRRVPAALDRIVEDLQDRGYESEAEGLRSEVEQRLSQAGVDRQSLESAAVGDERRGELPAKCPTCGGPLLVDDVEWSDPSTAACPYCGSPVKAT